MTTANLNPGQDIDSSLVAKAIALQPLLAANAEATENNREAHPDNVAALEDAGLFEVVVPKRVGGLGATLSTQLAVAAELGAACPSTAWVQTLLNVATWATSRSVGKCQDEVWGDGQRGRVFGVLAPTGTAAPVDGGYMVSGSWGFASGGFHGNWAGGGVFVLDAEGNIVAPGMATMPIAEVSIKDTWHVAGMQGTASNTVVAENVFVPAHRVGIGLDLNDTNGAPAEPSDRWPVGAVLALILAGPLLGAARAVADTVAAKAPSRGISYTTYFTTDSSQVALTELATSRRLGCTRSTLRRTSTRSVPEQNQTLARMLVCVVRADTSPTTSASVSNDSSMSPEPVPSPSPTPSNGFGVMSMSAAATPSWQRIRRSKHTVDRWSGRTPSISSLRSTGS
jgi:3-hydroxy-9,10-secoandrosta-1,3,5(10)-triene-9,17-dione monooxygenase